jgi:sugar (pentulose or hexulose) kinase
MGHEAERVAPGCEEPSGFPIYRRTHSTRRRQRPRCSVRTDCATFPRHAIRAVMEGVAFGLRDSLEIIRG